MFCPASSSAIPAWNSPTGHSSDSMCSAIASVAKIDFEHFERFNRVSRSFFVDSDHQHLMIRTLQPYMLVQRVHQFAHTVPGEKRQDRIITLLQMLIRENQPRHV